MAKKLRNLLQLAVETSSLARVRRSVDDDGEWADGYVLDVGPKWLLLAVVADASRYTGFEMYRIRDIIEFEIPAPHADFQKRALELLGLPRPTKPAISLQSTKALLASAAAAFPLVSICREHMRPGACWIGHVLSLRRNRVVFRKVDTDACWNDEDLAKFCYSDISRVDVGGPYENALYLVAADRDQALPGAVLGRK